MAILKIDEKTYAFGKYGGHVLIWDVIGEENGYSILLCREFVCLRRFDETSNNWEGSELRNWLNSDFLYSFDKNEKDRIVIKNDDYFFLLSEEEYNNYKDNIINLYTIWWLRSPGGYTDHAAYVGDGGTVGIGGDYVRKDIFGVRPAVLIRLPLSENNPQSDTKYYITTIRRCTHPGGFEYEAEPVQETVKFYCDDVKTTEKLWKMAKDKYKQVKLLFDETTNNNNDLKRLIDIND